MRKKEVPDAPIITIEEKEDKRFSDEYYGKILNKHRYILLYDEINSCSSDYIITKIKAMNFEDPKSPIYLEINSPGGDVSCGFAIINAIEHSSAPITTIISGEAASMGAMIFITGKTRKMYANSYIMFHPLSEGQADYLQFIKDRTKFLIHLESSMDKMCRKHTKFNEFDRQQMKGGELWLTAEQARRKGVCDEIIK